MNILHVAREYPPSRKRGGIGTYVKQIAEVLDQAGHNVFVICAADNLTDYSVSTEGNRITVVRLPGADFYVGSSLAARLKNRLRRITHFISYRWRVAREVRKLARQHKIDVIEFPEFGAEALIYLLSGRRDAPVVIRIHGPTALDNSQGRLASIFSSPIVRLRALPEHIALRRADAITYNSAGMRSVMTPLLKSFRGPQAIIHNCIDLESLPSLTSETARPRPSRSLEVVYAGTVVVHKGVVELVEAVRLLRERGLDINLTLAGAYGALGAQLYRRAITDPDYSAWLRVSGRVDRQKLFQMFANADVVALPSWWEPFGLVCIEAMAVGALVVGSSSGGMREIITDGVDGFLVAPRSPEALADCLAKAVALEERRRAEISAEAKKTVAARFNASQMCADSLAFYRDLIRNRTA
jgi:glycosyltransferase involved in cell wall biosynthesis